MLAWNIPNQILGCAALIVETTQVFMATADRQSHRPAAPQKGMLMNRNGRLELIKSTLSSMAVYISICMGLPPWVIKALEKIFKALLWTGTEVVQGSKCLLAWKKVQWLRHLGGLGVLYLKLFGSALCLRWLWLQ
jgi:hypothetical protein